MRCEECNGRGELYLRIAGDVHIAQCAACEGWGVIEPKPQELQRDPEFHKHQKFGSINLDELLGDE